jgi:putative ABC transport system permease protein
MNAFFYQLLQGGTAGIFDTLAYLPAALGFYLALRCLRFPDLTVEGSFVLGQALSAVFIQEHYSPWVALLLSVLGGAACGLGTALQHVLFKIPAFVCGIVTTFGITSFNYRMLGYAAQIGKERIVDTGYIGEASSLNLSGSGVLQRFYEMDLANRSLWGELRIVQSSVLAGMVALVVVVVWLALRSRLGLRVRAFGVHRTAGMIYVRKSSWAIVVGLALANAVVCLSGALAAQAYRLASMETGARLLIPLLAAVVLGEFVVDFVWPWAQKTMRLGSQGKPLLSRPLSLAVAPVVGFLVYNALFLGIAVVIVPAMGSGIGSVSGNNKYWITAAVILLVLIMRKADLGKRPPEEVV